MGITKIRDLDDGATVVRDADDGTEFVLKPGQLEQVQAVKADQQRALVERFVLANRTSGDPRSEAEQNAMDAASQGQGEAHQEQERG